MKERARLRNLATILTIFAILVLFGLNPNEQNIANAAAISIAKKTVTTQKALLKNKSTKDIKTLDEALKLGVPVIVKLGSDKCIPCRTMNPIIKELAAEQDGKAVFMALDVYQNRELAGKFSVRVIPTVIFFDKHGKPKAKKEGFMNKMELLKAVDELELNK